MSTPDDRDLSFLFTVDVCGSLTAVFFCNPHFKQES